MATFDTFFVSAANIVGCVGSVPFQRGHPNIMNVRLSANGPFETVYTIRFNTIWGVGEAWPPMMEALQRGVEEMVQELMQ